MVLTRQPWSHARHTRRGRGHHAPTVTPVWQSWRDSNSELPPIFGADIIIGYSGVSGRQTQRGL